ncbi:MAG: hypothetical protein GVY17_03250 [Cyanobacteria bacterium]|jgi:hypothetical protein|nr:hypothetical protein [Cyanobacteria bacterium GSL.Bin21]
MNFSKTFKQLSGLTTLITVVAIATSAIASPVPPSVLGNVVVAADGTAVWEETFPGLSLNNGDYTVVGRALILHADPDDFSQPIGNAGARIRCGAIILKPAP